jgi:hypothetical protein
MSVIDIVRENYKARAEIQGELRSIDEAATADKRDYTDEEKVTIDREALELEAIDERIVANLDIEVRGRRSTTGMDRFLGVLADRDNGEVPDTRSIGERFTDTDEYRAWAERRPRPVRRPEHDVFLDRKVYLLDLLPTSVTTGSVEYVQDKTPLADMANKAVEVTEGTAKPQAGPTLAVVTEPIATIAAWVNITRQAAADVPQIQGYLDTGSATR